MCEGTEHHHTRLPGNVTDSRSAVTTSPKVICGQKQSDPSKLQIIDPGSGLKE